VSADSLADFWHSGTIRLRAIEPSDADHFRRWNEDSERARHLDFLWPPTSHAAVETWTAEMSQKRLEDGAFHWVIENEAGEAVGSIATHHCDARNGTYQYAVAIAADRRRKGYASAAIRLVLRYYFQELRYQKVTVSVHADNAASIAFHERLGFQLEGRHRRMHFSGGLHVDVLWFGMTAEEFTGQL
jgi:RimJ/RimL family protein N-acetyltransferase